MGPRPPLCDAKRLLRSDLEFFRQYNQRSCHVSESGQVQRLCGTVGCGSRFGDRSGQICLGLGRAVWHFRPWHLERPFRRCALLWLLDCAAKLASALGTRFGILDPEPLNEFGSNTSRALPAVIYWPSQAEKLRPHGDLLIGVSPASRFPADEPASPR